MKNQNARSLERVYIDRFNEIKNNKIQIKKDSKIKPVIDTG